MTDPWPTAATLADELRRRQGEAHRANAEAFAAFADAILNPQPTDLADEADTPEETP